MEESVQVKSKAIRTPSCRVLPQHFEHLPQNLVEESVQVKYKAIRAPVVGFYHNFLSIYVFNLNT